VYYVPSWQTPIDVVLDDGIRGITFGLVSTALVEANWREADFPPLLIERLGRGTLIVAAQECGRVPRATRRASVLAPLLREFVTSELTKLVTPILTAATASGSVTDEPSDDEVLRLTRRHEEDVLSLISERGPRVTRPRRLRRGDRVVWGQTFAHLLERAATEIFELHATHTRVRRCRFCNSVFVPRRDEQVCKWNLWRAPVQVGEPALRLCDPGRATAARETTRPSNERTAYERERKKLWARYDRARRAALRRGDKPSSDPRVRETQQALAALVKNDGPPRGRPATREDTTDIVEERELP
jgi:hypothetical protein